MATIVLAEDEADLRQLIRRHLEAEGHRVIAVADGPGALLAARQEAVDLVVLDWMLPRLDGLEVCRRLRRESVVPIVMLTARAEEIDRVLGLEVGADDYITKPFSVRELLARVRALLRRVELLTTGPVDSPIPAIILGSLRIDVIQRLATIDGRPLELAPKEFELLALLARHPGRAFARDYLLTTIWGDDVLSSDRTVDTHILRLRKKLGSLADRIETVWSIGYRLAAEPRQS
jgi:DNA-binding response OmpR family regulator